MNKVTINGVDIYPFSKEDELISYVDKHKGILVAINAGKIHRATDETREIINKNIGYADGIGAVAALKKKGIQNATKIAGCDLWLSLVKKFYKTKSFYLVGATDEVINATVTKLKNEYPGIDIKGFRNGYLQNPLERNTLIKEVISKKPDIVFVAMGSPKQELLMGEMFQSHPAIYQGLGGSFKVYCGKEKRAPQWLVKHNLEGPYRFITGVLSNPKERSSRFFSDLLFFIKLYTNKIR